MGTNQSTANPQEDDSEALLAKFGQKLEKMTEHIENAQNPQQQQLLKLSLLAEMQEPCVAGLRAMRSSFSGDIPSGRSRKFDEVTGEFQRALFDTLELLPDIWCFYKHQKRALDLISNTRSFVLEKNLESYETREKAAQMLSHARQTFDSVKLPNENVLAVLADRFKALVDNIVAEVRVLEGITDGHRQKQGNLAILAGVLAVVAIAGAVVAYYSLQSRKARLAKEAADAACLVAAEAAKKAGQLKLGACIASVLTCASGVGSAVAAHRGNEARHNRKQAEIMYARCSSMRERYEKLRNSCEDAEAVVLITRSFIIEATHNQHDVHARTAFLEFLLRDDVSKAIEEYSSTLEELIGAAKALLAQTRNNITLLMRPAVEVRSSAKSRIEPPFIPGQIWRDIKKNDFGLQCDQLQWEDIPDSKGRGRFVRSDPSSDIHKFIEQHFASTGGGRLNRIELLDIPHRSESVIAHAITTVVVRDRGNPASPANPANPSFQTFREGVDKLKGSFLPNCYPDTNFVLSWHGTAYNNRYRVALSGLLPLRTTDGGYFGGGSYTTLDAHYAAEYTRSHMPGATGHGKYMMLLLLTCVGNAYVVTRDGDYNDLAEAATSQFYSATAIGAHAIKAGYDTHFVPVKKPHNQACRVRDATSFELVSREISQCCPVAIVYFD